MNELFLGFVLVSMEQQAGFIFDQVLAVHWQA